ncbi:MAG: DNA mismatch repair protein MutS [Hyphomicrobiaceae bacterium]
MARSNSKRNEAAEHSPDPHANAASAGTGAARPEATVPATRQQAPAARRQTAPVRDPGAPGVTPSMAQFLEIKTANPDCILWYRMGDFYELFFEDAVIASEALGIVLTRRGKHLGEDIPMCGVPVVRADEYLQRLIRQGFRVAVCEQLEDPAEARKRGSKAVVRRDVVRLVTPGTLTEDTLLDARSRNYLTAIFRAPGSAGSPDAQTYALASVDISTGEFEIAMSAASDLPGELVRLSPQETLVTDATVDDVSLSLALKAINPAITPVAGAFFDSRAGEQLLKERLGVSELGGFGEFSRPELAAIGALLRYIDLTQISARPALRPPRRSGPASTLAIDASSRVSLELLRTTSGTRDGSLLAAIDRTVTGPGARELAARLASPLKDVRAINARLDAVAFLLESAPLRDDLRQSLKSSPDIARAVSRITLGRGAPRDLGFVGDGLAAANHIATLLDNAAGAVGLPEVLGQAMKQITSVEPDLADRLAAALIDTPGHQKRDGGFVKKGYRPDLDEALRLRDDSRRVMATLEAGYIETTGIKNLKVRHNNILGFFIETSALNAKPLLSPPLSETFRHRQIMANAVRFTTTELVETEGRIASAAERALAIEMEVFAELETAIIAAQGALGSLSAALAEIDCLAALAELAERENYVRPTLETSTRLEIRDGRHPVVEQALKAQKAGPFVENDCVLGHLTYEPQATVPEEGRPPGFEDTADGRIWLVTGPNMAGKSTFLRQNALIVVLAQIGSFVPARSASIGIVDRLFSRVGASDDLARGRSTFMVEMVETAGILNQATDKSLVILDEIGRGTATFDGLSIAWATVEHLHEVNRCRALFATHYHELTTLATRLAEVANVTIDVKEWHDEIVFLHKVKKGAADRSYGIQVAKLAGLPKAVVDRAGEVLSVLEKGEPRGRRGKSSETINPVASLDELPLFSAARPKSVVARTAEPSPAEKALSDLNPDDLTPRAALDALYRLKALQSGKS